MYRKFAVITLTCLGSLNCFATDYQLTDTRARALVVADVLTAKCPSRKEWNSVPIDYRTAASRLLSVASVDADLYNQRYKKILEVTERQSEAEFLEDCSKFIPNISTMIPEMILDYEAYLGIISADRRREANRWSDALALIASTLSSVGQQAQSYNYNFIPMPSGRVNFGAGSTSGGGFNHYLVNTPGGLQQCHVSAKGYMFCN